MKEIQCPSRWDGIGKSLFVAGGISNCPLWQRDLIDLLKDTRINLLNPRREEYDTGNIILEEEQIKWEHDHLNQAAAVAFWFPFETVCPITLFELGKVAAGDKKPVFVGTHPDYARKRDIRWQMLLLRPEIDVVHSLEDLAGQIKKWSVSPLIPS